MDEVKQVKPEVIITELVAQVLSNGTTPAGGFGSSSPQQNGHSSSFASAEDSGFGSERMKTSSTSSNTPNEDYMPNFSQYESHVRNRKFHASNSSPTFEKQRSQDSQHSHKSHTSQKSNASTSDSSNHSDSKHNHQQDTSTPAPSKEKEQQSNQKQHNHQPSAPRRPAHRPNPAPKSTDRSRSSSMHRVKSEPTLGVDYTKEEIEGVKRLRLLLILLIMLNESETNNIESVLCVRNKVILVTFYS